MNIQIITDDCEIYRKADELGLRDFFLETAKQIQLLADAHPGQPKFVINKSIKHEIAFVVVMATSGDLFGDAVMLLDWGHGQLAAPTSSTIEELDQDFAHKMLEMLSDAPCMCDKCGQPTNLN
jgi:hypothetical protein